MPKAKEVVKKAKKESKTKGQKIPEIDEKYGCFLWKSQQSSTNNWNSSLDDTKNPSKMYKNYNQNSTLNTFWLHFYAIPFVFWLKNFCFRHDRTTSFTCTPSSYRSRNGTNGSKSFGNHLTLPTPQNQIENEEIVIKEREEICLVELNNQPKHE